MSGFSAFARSASAEPDHEAGPSKTCGEIGHDEQHSGDRRVGRAADCCGHFRTRAHERAAGRRSGAARSRTDSHRAAGRSDPAARRRAHSRSGGRLRSAHAHDARDRTAADPSRLAYSNSAARRHGADRRRPGSRRGGRSVGRALRSGQPGLHDRRRYESHTARPSHRDAADRRPDPLLRRGRVGRPGGGIVGFGDQRGGGAGRVTCGTVGRRGAAAAGRSRAHLRRLGERPPTRDAGRAVRSSDGGVRRRSGARNFGGPGIRELGDCITTWGRGSQSA